MRVKCENCEGFTSAGRVVCAGCVSEEDKLRKKAEKEAEHRLLLARAEAEHAERIARLTSEASRLEAECAAHLVSGRKRVRVDRPLADLDETFDEDLKADPDWDGPKVLATVPAATTRKPRVVLKKEKPSLEKAMAELLTCGDVQVAAPRTPDEDPARMQVQAREQPPECVAEDPARAQAQVQAATQDYMQVQSRPTASVFSQIKHEQDKAEMEDLVQTMTTAAIAP